MPDWLRLDQAAGYPLSAETALRILRLARVKPGETLLVNGASGGVGSAVMQIARHRGVAVIGIASEPHHEYLRRFGAIPATYGRGLSHRPRRSRRPDPAAEVRHAGSQVISLADAAMAQEACALGHVAGRMVVTVQGW
jgi:NADPH:quinone reductase-like Zn-dependent oxidoreductase